ncbi:DUF2110 family protein [Candidatus Thorarchaeota archaeon]|nr:MAG: DUF2110 family protein [Candidatus Thorarchaeota archaeon]
MMELTLLARVYGDYQNRLIRDFETDLHERTSELDIRIEKVSIDERGHIIVSLDGDDEEFVSNTLAGEYGTTTSLRSLSTGDVYSGQLRDVGKVGYGVYVDVGITNPSMSDALVPLHKLRSQFEMNASVRSIAGSFVLVDNLPVTVEVVHKDERSVEIEAEFTSDFIGQLDTWSNDDHQRLLVFGANRDMIDGALERTNHRQDIYEIERLGPFEFSLRCKRSTRATGIIAAIGPVLRGVPMHLFIPREIGD